MTYRHINRVAVIGSGTMGSALAALLLGAGLETTLLDIPAAGTTSDAPAAQRNALPLGNLQRSLTARPSPWFSAADVGRIRVGNLEDDLAWLADVDWVLEAVVEDLAVKQALMTQLNQVCGPRCIISSNTSGLPLAQIAAGLPRDFTQRFLGTHFFNPPRWLPLLELIPHEDTDGSAAGLHAGLLRARPRQGRGCLPRRARLPRQPLPLHVEHAGHRPRPRPGLQRERGGRADRAAHRAAAHRHLRPAGPGRPGCGAGRGPEPACRAAGVGGCARSWLTLARPRCIKNSLRAAGWGARADVVSGSSSAGRMVGANA